MFEITSDPINHGDLASKIDDLKAGGLVFFDGRVRNHNDGHQVKSLEYQCYESMAKKVGLKIVDEAIEKFNIHHAFCLHREGHLALGDTAVWVGVSASHRGEAFEACQYIIDEVKTRVPIWKKEHYVNLPAEWVACHTCGQHVHKGDHV